MKKIIIARHGDYDDFGKMRLNAPGKYQMRELAKKLQPFLGDSNVIILASTALRASMSGEVMADELDCPIEFHKVLVSGGGTPCNNEKVLKLIQSYESFDIVVLVTHLEYSGSLPPFIGEHLLGVELNPFATNKGEAWVIDIKEKTQERVH